MSEHTEHRIEVTLQFVKRTEKEERKEHIGLERATWLQLGWPLPMVACRNLKITKEGKVKERLFKNPTLRFFHGSTLF